jgi:hypothetical protein
MSPEPDSNKPKPGSTPALIAYGRYVDFSDEPALQYAPRSPMGDTVRPAVVVKRRLIPPVGDSGTAGQWQSMSGCQVRYHQMKDGAADRWCIEVQNALMLAWTAGDGVVEYFCGPQYSPQRLQFWVLHTLLPVMLSLQGEAEFLHASAVEAGGEALVFTAPSFGGKSTLASYFLQRGHRLVSDDALGFEKSPAGWQALPSHPFFRQYRAAEQLGKVRPNSCISALPVRAIYLLASAPPQHPVEIVPVSGVTAFRHLARQQFAAVRRRKQGQFEWLAELARSVPVYELRIPWAMDRLAQVYAKVLAG